MGGAAFRQGRYPRGRREDGKPRARRPRGPGAWHGHADWPRGNAAGDARLPRPGLREQRYRRRAVLRRLFHRRWRNLADDGPHAQDPCPSAPQRAGKLRDGIGRRLVAHDVQGRLMGGRERPQALFPHHRFQDVEATRLRPQRHSRPRLLPAHRRGGGRGGALRVRPPDRPRHPRRLGPLLRARHHRRQPRGRPRGRGLGPGESPRDPRRGDRRAGLCLALPA